MFAQTWIGTGQLGQVGSEPGLEVGDQPLSGHQAVQQRPGPRRRRAIGTDRRSTSRRSTSRRSKFLRRAWAVPQMLRQLDEIQRRHVLQVCPPRLEIAGRVGGWLRLVVAQPARPGRPRQPSGAEGSAKGAVQPTMRAVGVGHDLPQPSAVLRVTTDSTPFRSSWSWSFVTGASLRGVSGPHRSRRGTAGGRLDPRRGGTLTPCPRPSSPDQRSAGAG